MAGDALACEQLCELFAKVILFQTRLLVRNKSDAEDVAQKVAIEMLRDISQLKSPYAFRSWLQRLIVNSCAKQNSLSQRELYNLEGLESAESIVDEGATQHLENGVEAEEAQLYIGGYLAKLPPAQSVALTLYYYEQLSYKEIAVTMGVSVGSVSNTISKAKKNLSKLLKDNNDNGVLGIVYRPPARRKRVKQTVIHAVEDSVSQDSVDRFMVVCRSNIALLFAGGGVIANTAHVGTTIMACVSAALMLSGLGVGTYFLMSYEKRVPGNSSDNEPIVLTDSRVIYSVPREQQIDLPLNPMTAELELLPGEKFSGWILAKSDGQALYSGSRAEVHINSLGLPDGDYTLCWYLTTASGHEARVYWSFTIINDAAAAEAAAAAAGVEVTGAAAGTTEPTGTTSELASVPASVPEPASD
jgi:RNA polymerase sigma-70 factor (ECF subfamily)